MCNIVANTHSLIQRVCDRNKVAQIKNEQLCTTAWRHTSWMRRAMTVWCTRVACIIRLVSFPDVCSALWRCCLTETPGRNSARICSTTYLSVRTLSHSDSPWTLRTIQWVNTTCWSHAIRVLWCVLVKIKFNLCVLFLSRTTMTLLIHQWTLAQWKGRWSKTTMKTP